MQIYDYEKLVSNWKATLNAIEKIGGEVDPLFIDVPATPDEIRKTEENLGFKLPPSLKKVLLEFSRRVSFRWRFPDETNLPTEFREIGWGEMGWDIQDLVDLTLNANEAAEDGDDYLANLRCKLQFFYVPNGDCWVFHMNSDFEEPPVFYWDHEEDSFTYVADSFWHFVVKISELHSVGSEIWHFEKFLDSKGLNPYSELSLRWKQWFTWFTETELHDVENNLSELIEYVLSCGKLDERVVEAFKRHDQSNAFAVLKENLKTGEKQRRFFACKIIGDVLGSSVAIWVRSLWNEENSLDSDLKAYLSSRCLPEEEVLSLVFSHLENRPDGKVPSYESGRLLSHFRSRKVLPWMERHVRFPVDEGWDGLFAVSNPTWHDVSRWLHLEERHQTTAIQGLYLMLNPKTYMLYPDEIKKILDPPSKDTIVKTLFQVREEQVLMKRKRMLDEIISRIEELI